MEYGEYYYSIKYDPVTKKIFVILVCNVNDFDDYMRMKLGLVFKSASDARKSIDKIIEDVKNTYGMTLIYDDKKSAHD